MAALDQFRRPVVVGMSDISAPRCSRGPACPLATIVENLDDLSISEVMEQFDVTSEQIATVGCVSQRLRATSGMAY